MHNSWPRRPSSSPPAWPNRQLPVLAQAMGAEGLRDSHPFGRHLAGARVASFVDGSSEVQLERIAALQR